MIQISVLYLTSVGKKEILDPISSRQDDKKASKLIIMLTLLFTKQYSMLSPQQPSYLHCILCTHTQNNPVISVAWHHYILRQHRPACNEGIRQGNDACCISGPSGIAPSPHSMLKQGFMRIFPRNQSVTVKLTFELIFIKFKYFFDVLANPRPICFTQMIHQCVNHKKRLSLRYPLTNFSNFSFFQTSL